MHFRRDYDMTRPFNCVAANVTEYIKTLAQAQELNVDEAEVRCQNQDDVCFGTIEVRKEIQGGPVGLAMGWTWVDFDLEVPPCSLA